MESMIAKRKKIRKVEQRSKLISRNENLSNGRDGNVTG